MDNYPILSGALALKLDGAVARAQLALPALLRRDDPDALLVAVGQHPPRLPPLVVRGVRHVQDVAVAEEQAAARQAVVLVRVVIEKRPLFNLKI